MTTLSIGIISQTLVQQHHLRNVVEECGHKASTAWLINHVLGDLDLLASSQAIDAWLIDIDTFSLERTDTIALFENWLFDLKVPIIFGEGHTYNATEESFKSWLRQITTKLLSLTGELYLHQEQQRPADFVWVLAASTGGPEAVKQFLDALPAGLGVAFIYAQHIESQQNKTLAMSVTRDNHYRGCVAEHGDILCADTVTVAPAKKAMDLLPDGTIVIRDKPWRGQYKPSIDQIVATVADRFGVRGGTIFFSGMGSDGVIGARIMSSRTGRVWIQAPVTCASDMMPAAINQTGCVTATGSPKQLANYLENSLKDLKKEAVLME